MAALIGGVVNFLGGWLVYGIILDPYFRTLMTPEGMAIIKDPPLLGGIFGGSVIWALLLALIYHRWASISTLKTGAIAGAVISLLVALSVDLSVYSMWNISSFMVVIVDPIGSAVLGAITGAVVGWILGYGGRKA